VSAALPSDASTKQARDARARALAFALARYFERKKAARPGGPENAERSSSAIGAKSILHQAP